MTTHPRSARLPLAALVLLLALVLGAAPATAQGFGTPEPGHRVYDRSGLLTAAEVAMLEQRVAAVERAGAPAVVYLQPKDATFGQTLRDARDLMDAWDIQSATAARDGVVIFLNLDPGDLRRGQLALVAGAAHFDGGNLPQRELDRIADAMIERLRRDDTAGGIALGLEMVAHSLAFGPPPPPEPGLAQRAAESFAGDPVSPLNVLAVVVIGGAAWVTARVWRSRPRSTVAVTPTIAPPAGLSPAIAGALTLGRIHDSQLEATVLDFAMRGGLSIEPEGKGKAQIRLRDPSIVNGEFELRLWESLAAEANDDGVITSKRVPKVRSHWRASRDALRAELEAHGWFARDPSARRRPAFIAGIAAVVIAGVAAVAVVGGSHGWGVIGVGLLLVGGLVVLVFASVVPDTTIAGEDTGQLWRGYRQGLKDAKDNTDIDLDLAVPYSLAMNALTTLDKRLKAASAAGYAPLWLGSQPTEPWGRTGFYLFFSAFHASITPSSSGGGSAGSGGASAGSGGAGGRF